MRSRVQRVGACCLISSRILIVHPLAVAVSHSYSTYYAHYTLCRILPRGESSASTWQGELKCLLLPRG